MLLHALRQRRSGIRFFAAFLDGRLRWSIIAETIDHVLQLGGGPADTVDDVLFADATAREIAQRYIEKVSL